MGLGMLVTNLEHEEKFHCKVSSKTAHKLLQNYIIYLVLTFLLI